MAEDELEGLIREVARAPDAVLPALPGTRVGRFEIVQRIGAGGMGVVHEAIDPTLGRRVAIKLLRSGDGDSGRLLREAQALARLAHPNVVTIFEAGRDGDHVYIAMELIGGKTARDWQVGRGLVEILDVYRQAAAGLAAAHRTGLVHRDVKPENILVGDDGRVRVTDFGLAAAMGEAVQGELPDTEVLTRTLTQTGAVLGTPAYMPPEAFARGELDARSDQWSLCVALWEAIAGERPFTGSTIGELAAAIRTGKPALERLPARVRPALARGLSVDPAARWPSVEALAAALGRRRVPRAVFAGVGVAVAAGAAVLLWPRASASHASPPAKAPAVAATPVKRTTGGCPYMPAYVDDDTIVFDDGNGDLHVIRGDEAPAPLVTDPAREDWRANRGRRPGEAVFIASDGSHGRAAFVDVATGAVEISTTLEGGSFAFGGGAMFYTRTDLPQVRRVVGTEDAPLFTLPDGRWPYTVAASADGRRTAVTTATDRSVTTICLGEDTSVTCLDRTDVIRGRAAFTPDGDTLYYQTSAGIRRRTGADDTLWLPGVEALGGIDVSPSGRTLVYSDDRPRGVEAAPLDALDAPVVVGAALAPVFAGDRWFYTRAVAGGVELVAQATDGASVVLTTLTSAPSGLWVDAGGKHVAFDLDGDAPGIYIVDARAYPPVRVTTFAGDSNPVFTADGKIAFARWDAKMQASLVIADPALGVKDDAARVAAHPMPRVPLSRLPSGELVLVGVDDGIYLWDPATGRERTVDVSGLGGRAILQIAASPDGRSLAVLASGKGYEVWRLPLAADAGPTTMLLAQPDCGTFDRPQFGPGGVLYAVSAPWRGDVYTVSLE